MEPTIREPDIKGVFLVREIETRTAKKGNTYQSLTLEDFNHSRFKTQVFNPHLWDGFQGLPKPGELLYIELYQDGDFLRPLKIQIPTEQAAQRFMEAYKESPAEPRNHSHGKMDKEDIERMARSTAIKAASHLYGAYMANAGAVGQVRTIDLDAVLDIADTLTEYIMTGKHGELEDQPEGD